MPTPREAVNWRWWREICAQGQRGCRQWLRQIGQQKGNGRPRSFEQGGLSTNGRTAQC